MDVMYLYAEKIILMMDNFNIHKPASLYKKHPPAEEGESLDRWRFRQNMTAGWIWLKSN